MRFFNSLTGRFLALTVVFVMLAEILIFVPSVSRFRLDYLQARLDLSQVASLTLLATPDDMVDTELEAELLRNAEVLNIVLRRDLMRELILESPLPQPVSETFDLRNASAATLIWDALRTVFGPTNRVIRVIGMPVKSGGVEIEATLLEGPLRAAMLDYGRTILWLSLIISAITATALFFAVRWLIVRPVRRVIHHMTAYRDNPEDPGAVIEPKAGINELHEAEAALADLQSQVTQSLRQKDRLATLGGAVSRISHDLRNMLTTAQLLADRFETSNDPTVKRTAPKLIGSLSRAINLCEGTLAFGKAEEAAPDLARVRLARIVEDVLESDRLRRTEVEIDLINGVLPDAELIADEDQLFRILTNLVRNSRQAIEDTQTGGEIRIEAVHGDAGHEILISDTGPGLPPKALEKIFCPFEGGARRGGTGLGLAIAAELVKAHDGKLELIQTSDKGTTFRITLPDLSDRLAA
ncbi:sensor histidine kinase [Halovulum sp. GXIMD14793]